MLVKIQTKYFQFRNSLIFHSQSIHNLNYLYIYLNEKQISIDVAVKKKTNENGSYIFWKINIS